MPDDDNGGMIEREDDGSIDFTGLIGPLSDISRGAAWPMYSFGSPAYMLWDAIGNALLKQGWTEAEIKQWLQSEESRWAMDGELGRAIEALGRTFAGTLARPLVGR